jgi:hypothetical protein
MSSWKRKIMSWVFLDLIKRPGTFIKKIIKIISYLFFFGWTWLHPQNISFSLHAVQNRASMIKKDHTSLLQPWVAFAFPTWHHLSHLLPPPLVRYTLTVHIEVAHPKFFDVMSYRLPSVLPPMTPTVPLSSCCFTGSLMSPRSPGPKQLKNLNLWHAHHPSSTTSPPRCLHPNTLGALAICTWRRQPS